MIIIKSENFTHTPKDTKKIRKIQNKKNKEFSHNFSSKLCIFQFFIDTTREKHWKNRQFFISTVEMRKMKMKKKYTIFIVFLVFLFFHMKNFTKKEWKKILKFFTFELREEGRVLGWLVVFWGILWNLGVWSLDFAGKAKIFRFF